MNDSVKYIVVGAICIIGIIVISKIMENMQPSNINSNTNIKNDSHNVSKNTNVGFDIHDILNGTTFPSKNKQNK